MSLLNPPAIQQLYERFHQPIAAFDCGKKCSPYNEGGIPFCCDTRHMVPTAYLAEWAYLKANTTLWRLWDGNSRAETRRLQSEAPPGQVLIACLGHKQCQREFRALTCRAFPFYPYFDSGGRFLGLSCYWEYADRCWVINHLEVVSPDYRNEFIAAFETLFQLQPAEREVYQRHSAVTRHLFTQKRRTIPLLHRDGLLYKISPRNEILRPARAADLPKYGPYRIAAQLPFPDELQ